MSAEDFYYEFKQALNYLGVGFSGMGEAQIYIENGKVVMSAGNKDCSIKLSEKAETK